MGEREAERWREFYWAAVLEEDSNHIPERLDTAHAAIKARLKVLPHGLDDLKEMRRYIPPFAVSLGSDAECHAASHLLALLLIRSP